MKSSRCCRSARRWRAGCSAVRSPGRGGLAVGLAVYLGALAYNDAQPIATPGQADLADWLVAHHLKSGLAGYWESNITTLDSDGQVRVASVVDGGTAADAYESDSSWYNPKVSTANFIVSVSYRPQTFRSSSRPWCAPDSARPPTPTTSWSTRSWCTTTTS